MVTSSPTNTVDPINHSSQPALPRTQWTQPTTHLNQLSHEHSGPNQPLISTTSPTNTVEPTNHSSQPPLPRTQWTQPTTHFNHLSHEHSGPNQPLISTTSPTNTVDPTNHSSQPALPRTQWTRPTTHFNHLWSLVMSNGHVTPTQSDRERGHREGGGGVSRIIE